MKRLALLLPLALCGCGTAPVADFLDWARPARPVPANGDVRGGVVAQPPPDLPPPPGFAPPAAPVSPPAGPIIPPAPSAAVTAPAPVWPQ